MLFKIIPFLNLIGFFESLIPLIKKRDAGFLKCVKIGVIVISPIDFEKIDKVLDAVVKGLVKLLYNEDLYESDETSSLDPGYQPWQLFFWPLF